MHGYDHLCCPCPYIYVVHKKRANLSRFWPSFLSTILQLGQSGMESSRIKAEILAWIQEFARPNLSTTFTHESGDEQTDNNNFSEDPYVSDVINNDCHKVVKEVRINGQVVPFGQDNKLHGDGSLTFDTTEDYFRGEFFGSVGDREGSLIKVSQGGAVTYGVWKNGLLQVI